VTTRPTLSALCVSCSGAATNLKVGEAHGRNARKKFVVPLHFFGSTSTISRFGEPFRGGQYSFLFAVRVSTLAKWLAEKTYRD